MGRRAQRKRSPGRSAEIEARRLAGDRERLAHLAEGATAERPIAVASPAEVDVIGAAAPCPTCGRATRLLAHQAVVVAGERLRVARTWCAWCRTERAIYFALRPTPLH